MEEIPIEELIQRLYASENSGNTKLIEEIHKILIKHQRSDKSLKLANLCMNCSDLNVQFFGASTFQMKMNSNWDNFSYVERISLSMNILNWLKVYIDGPIVILRKLVSALSIFALKTIPEAWMRPINSLAVFLVFNQEAQFNNITTIFDIKHLLGLLNHKQKRILLMFSSSFLEEIGKAKISLSKRNQLHQAIQDSSVDVNPLLEYSFELFPNDSENIEVICEAIHCFQVWVFYSSDSSFTLQNILYAYEDIFESIISCLLHKETFLVAANALNDIISHSPKSLSEKLMSKTQEVLYNCWKDINLVENFQRNNGFDKYIVVFSCLIITLCEANIDFFFHDLTHEKSEIFIEIMLDLLGYPGFAVFQEDISIRTLEFFSLLIEMFHDSPFQKKANNNTISYMKNITEKVLEKCLIKLRWPPKSFLENLSKDICDKFIDYRRDIGNLLETIFSFLQAKLFEKLTIFLNHFLLKTLNWEDIEAIIFSLVYISDIYPKEESESDKYIFRIFSSNLFSILSSSSNIQVKHTALELAGSYGSFMRRYPSVIPSVLTFMFSYLENPELSYISSKSIYKLSSECRFLIVKELPAFIHIFKTISHTLTFSFDTKYKIFAAISCIIQSLPGNEQMEPLNILIQKIIEDLELARSFKFEDFDKSVNLALSCINCLAFIGKSLVSCTVTDTCNHGKCNSNLSVENNKFVADDLMKIFFIAEEICNNSEEITQCICDVFKSGFLEYFFGISFSKSHLFIEYLLKRFESYRYPCLISSAAYFVAHKKINDIANNIDMLGFILYKFTSLFMSFLEKNNINEISDIPPSVFDNIMTLTISSLSSKDNLVQKGAINFLIDFITFPSNNKENSDLILNVILHYGFFIVKHVMTGIVESSSENFHIFLSDLLYKLSLKFPQNVRNWLLEVINEDTFPYFNLNKSYKIDFVNKFSRIRTFQKTKELINEFWSKIQNMENMSSVYI
ncbi:hypothetical protein PMAC_002717 [Pneumocystis sp. 'macacae']|nr:hypothetical protein PMAC_002717 [Pneumocystis sp. 'macacae']